MTAKITYYAITNEFSSLERPGGVLRRVEDDGGRNDEVFTRNLKWEPSPLLYSAERGNLDNKFFEISEEEAERIVVRIRASVAEDKDLPFPRDAWDRGNDPPVGRVGKGGVIVCEKDREAGPFRTQS